MSQIVIREGFASLTEAERRQWMTLFSECFEESLAVASAVLHKYEIQGMGAVFCFGVVNDKIVASYSGAVLNMQETNIFLSMDTMSNGTMKGATVQLGRYLYDYLAGQGVAAVCGFPNKNILKIRELKLGWKIVGGMAAYVGIPILWQCRRNAKVEKELWLLRRPACGFHLKRNRFVVLLGRHGLYAGQKLSVVLTLAAQKPGMFFIKIPSFIIPPKAFGYRMLIHDSASQSLMERAAMCLDLETIDVP